MNKETLEKLSRYIGREITEDYFMSALPNLTPREQEVLTMRFGIEDGVSHILEDVGKKFSVTRERIRQIEAKAMEKIRHHHETKELNGKIY